MYRFNSERTWTAVLWLSASCSALLLLGIVGFLLNEAIPVFTEVGLLRFFTDERWSPSGTFGKAQYNLLPMIVGSVLVSALALLISVPLGLATAVHLRYFASTRSFRVQYRLLEIVSGIPSVVFGLWGLVTLVPIIAAIRAPGTSILAGAIVLALMITPGIALLSYSALAAIAPELERSALALGMQPWDMIRSVSLPVARPGIIAGIVVQAARSFGETMAVLMVCGNVVQLPSSAFDPIRTLTANIALEMAYAADLHRHALFVSGLLLLLVVAALALLASRVERSYA